MLGGGPQSAPRFTPGGTVTSPPAPGAVSAPRMPGEVLLGIRQALTPRFMRRGLLPSGRDFISGRVSALGVPPDDFWADLERGFPTGINPAQITRANFSEGGMVYNVPRSDYRVLVA